MSCLKGLLEYNRKKCQEFRNPGKAADILMIHEIEVEIDLFHPECF
jgi:hypothetical protein